MGKNILVRENKHVKRKKKNCFTGKDISFHARESASYITYLMASYNKIFIKEKCIFNNNMYFSVISN